MSGAITIRQSYLIVLALILTGCAPSFLSFGLKAKKIEISADRDANDSSPVAVDVLVVYDEGVLEKLAQLPASQWFGTREQWKLDAPTKLRVTELEMVPGSVAVVRLGFRERYKAAGGLVFAGYPGAGEHRLRVDDLSKISIRLSKSSLELVQ